MSKKLVIIPAYNEEETIYEVVTKALQYADVSVTDDGSRDNTPVILEKITQECKTKQHLHRLNVITHSRSTHIPQGIQDGMKFAVAGGYQHIVTMDAGMSHDPDVLPDFFNYDPDIDVLIGSRTRVENAPLYRRLISRLAAGVVNYSLTDSFFSVSGLGVRDCTSGFRRYSRRAAEKIASRELKSVSFDFHMEALACCVRDEMLVKEIPITYVFSNSSFNRKVLQQAMKFGMYLVSTKGRREW